MEKTVYLKEWKQRIENENIKVLKNWYTNNNQVECILQFSNLRGNNIKINLFNMGIKENCLKICNLSLNQESTYDGYVGEKIEYCLNENEEIIKFVVDDNVFIIPWMGVEVLASEWSERIKKENRYNVFSDVLDNMRSFYYHDEDYLALKSFEKEGTILDIGANYGQSMYAFYQLSKSQIISVEPVPELYSILCLFKEYFDKENRVRIINSGISDQEQSLIWYEPNKKNISGSFDKEIIESRKLDVSFTEKILMCRTIDDLFGDIDDVWFIKIDVEGLEYKAILGALKIIKKHFPIMLIEENVQKDPIYELLKDYYEIYYYNPDRDIFSKEKVGGINYWLIPKKPFRKLVIDNIE